MSQKTELKFKRLVNGKSLYRFNANLVIVCERTHDGGSKEWFASVFRVSIHPTIGHEMYHPAEWHETDINYFEWNAKTRKAVTEELISWLVDSGFEHNPNR